MSYPYLTTLLALLEFHPFPSSCGVSTLVKLPTSCFLPNVTNRVIHLLQGKWVNPGWSMLHNFPSLCLAQTTQTFSLITYMLAGTGGKNFLKPSSTMLYVACFESQVLCKLKCLLMALIWPHNKIASSSSNSQLLKLVAGKKMFRHNGPQDGP